MRINDSKFKHNKGFTLIELLVSISIIAVLSTVGFVTYSNAQIAARDSKRKQDLRSMQTALEIYYQKNNSYPIAASGIKSSSGATWNPLLDTDYINAMPHDPKEDSSAQNYVYSSNATGSTYLVCAKFENASDPDKNSVCTISGYNYGIVNP